MGTKAKTVAAFGMLAALSLVLGYVDRSLPLTWFLSGAVPGIKLGLANTVLLYAVYMMDWKSCILLMLVKVFLSGFLFGSMSAIMYSLAGGILSLAVMLPTRKNARAGAFVIGILAAISDLILLLRVKVPRGQMLWCMLLIAAASLAAFIISAAIRKNPRWEVLGTSLSGAVAHNIGQVLMAVFIMETPHLLYTYLPVLVGIGAVVGCLTGIAARRVFTVLRVSEI